MPANGRSEVPLHDHTERFRFPSSKGDLARAMSGLLEAQKASWKMLADGYAALEQVRQRVVECSGFKVTLQFNPGRMTSTAARVDAESIKQRACFLCVENLPKEQEGLLYDEEFVILCNPAPIFDRHYTVSHLNHRPQVLEQFLERFLSLAHDISPAFSIFYNGPRCGASAPDHMHFQACPAGLIPVERESRESGKRILASSDKTRVFTLKEYGREVIVVEGSDQARLRETVVKILAALRRATQTAEEPMVNVLCSYDAGEWRLNIFPRRKHRPDAFFRNDDSRILVSPAAVDMGGLIITPSEKDFERLDAKAIEQIYAEVSLEHHVVQHALEGL